MFDLEPVVGRLRVDDNGQFSFAYDHAWLTRDGRFPVSLTLPIAVDEYVGGPAHTLFANLLPEGAVRQAVAHAWVSRRTTTLHCCRRSAANAPERSRSSIQRRLLRIPRRTNIKN
jgi:HipA-like protein